jgi:Zn-dependent protease with chaperone function
MTFRRSLLLLVCLILLLTGSAMVPAVAQNSSAPAAQSAPSEPAPAMTSEPRKETNAQQVYTLPPDKLAKAIALSRIRDILNISGSIWGIVFLWLLLALNGWAGLERWAEKISGKRWIQGLIFFALLLIISSVAGLPFDWLGQHYERAYGISVQGWVSWFGDEGKALGLTLLFGAPILLLFNRIVWRWPRRYWLGIWLVTLPILVFAVFVEPLLEPVFNKFEPLEKTNPALVQQLEKVVARTGTNIPADRMFLMKASLKTNGLNAYVSGIGATKRIVVWDTTAGRVPDDEVMFIFGHESGHYVLHHVPKEIGGDAMGLFFVYWGCAALAAWMVRRSGVRWGAVEMSSRTGFVVLLFAISIASFLLEPAGNAFSRSFEHEADIYGQEATHGVVPDPRKTAVAAFNDLGKAWLEDPKPNSFIEFWFYSHPSAEERANFAEHYDPWKNGGHGEFFKN